MKIGNQPILQPNQGIQNNVNTGALKGFIVSVGQGISKMGNAISNFFKNTLPNFFKSLSERFPSIGSPPQPRLHSLIDFEDFANQPISNEDDDNELPLDLSGFPSQPSISEHEELMSETTIAYQKYNKANILDAAKNYPDEPIDEEIELRPTTSKKSDEIKDTAGKETLGNSEISDKDINKLMEELVGSKDLPGSFSSQTSIAISTGGKKDISQDLESLLNELAEEVKEPEEGATSFSTVNDQMKQIFEQVTKEVNVSKDLENLINELADEVKEPENGGTLHQALNEDMKKMVGKATDKVLQEIAHSNDLPKGVQQDIIKILGESQFEEK